MENKKFTYSGSGVDIDKASALVGDIAAMRRRTEGRRQLYGAFGLFAAGFDLSGYRQPVLMTGCDGVGSKIELLIEHGLLETAGKDLVAMNVNDVMTTGAEPVLFLDYLGVARIDKRDLARIIEGMVSYLEDCGCILAGGETAEMPGIVPEGAIELSGFCIGVAEKEDLLEPASIREDDVIIGYPSQGFHANGWSLVRQVLGSGVVELSEAEVISLLLPTLLYHREAEALRKMSGVRAMAHITGGGLPENLGRLLTPLGFGAELEVPRWEFPGVGAILRHVEEKEAFRAFNMGFGWAAIVSEGAASAAMAVAPGATLLGRVSGGVVGVECRVR
jgi:phosphoribosylformylglycinamidine cyclo-ligase